MGTLVKKAEEVGLRGQKATYFADQLRRLAEIADSSSTGREALRQVETELDALHDDLDRAEDEAEAIYGDQSDNATYYFNRKPKRAGTELEDAEDEADSVYGDQSRDETYYDGMEPRTGGKCSCGRSLEEAEREAGDVYGDLSETDTYYTF